MNSPETWRQKGDRSKALSFEDFQRYAFRTGHDSEPSKEGKLAKPKASKPAESKRASSSDL